MEVSGHDDAEKNLGKITDKIFHQIRDELEAGGWIIHGEAVKLIQEVSNGRRTVRYRDGRHKEVTVSKRGEAPNTDTGRLVSSIFVREKDKAIYVGSDVDYGRYLELSLDRPWLIPAKKKSEKKIFKILVKGLKRVLEKDEK